MLYDHLPDLLTVAETAEFLRMTPGAIYNLRYKGEKPGSLGLKFGEGRGSRLRFRKADLLDYLDQLAGARP